MLLWHFISLSHIYVRDSQANLPHAKGRVQVAFKQNAHWGTEGDDAGGQRRSRVGRVL